MIEFYKWYKRYRSDLMQYFYVTAIPDLWGKKDWFLSFIMYPNEDDNYQDIKKFSFALMNLETLEKGDIRNKAGDYQEIDGSQQILTSILGKKMGKKIIPRIFDKRG